MEAVFVHFRMGRHHQNTHQVVLKVADTAEEAQKVVGKIEVSHGCIVAASRAAA